MSDPLKEEVEAAHAIAAAVAEDVALTVRAGIEDAQRRGQPFESFARTFRGLLSQHGWWGARDQVDPRTGLPIATPEKVPHRLALVIQTNTRTARAAGEWTNIQRRKARLPLLIYRHGHPERDRPEHVPYWSAPIVLPVDHPFWDLAMPPNGYLCTCYTEQVAAGSVTANSELPQPIERGGYTTLPGIDPEWAYNPGKNRLEGLRRAGILRQR